MAHLDEHRLLLDKQHALRKWHSCETKLTTVIDDWAKVLDNQGQSCQGQVDTFILNFEKAFGTPLMNFLPLSIDLYILPHVLSDVLGRCVHSLLGIRYQTVKRMKL